MSKSQKRKRNAHPPAPAAVGPRFPRPVAVVLAVAVVAAGGYWWIKGRHADSRPAVAPLAGTQATNPPASAVTVTMPAFQKLKGKWLRPDGGYVLEILSVEPGGKMDAAYFNPRSIHIAKAEASQESAVTKVFIELRDVNYPGSTYHLAYDAESDQLAGVYYQAALQQQFEVVFVRMK